MSDIIQTRLNGQPFSMKSCAWFFAGAPFVGVLALDYEQKRERKLVHGSRRDGTPLGITSGKYSVGALSVTFLRSSYQRLIEILSAPALGNGSYGDAKFPIIAQYSEPASLEPPITISIVDACIVNEKDTYAEGIDELVTEVDLMAMTLSRNGLQLWSVVKSLGGQ